MKRTNRHRLAINNLETSSCHGEEVLEQPLYSRRRGANLPSFITDPLWGLFDRAASRSHRRPDPLSTARDADSSDANGN